jgi:hypothetical protein
MPKGDFVKHHPSAPTGVLLRISDFGLRPAQLGGHFGGDLVGDVDG